MVARLLSAGLLCWWPWQIPLSPLQGRQPPHEAIAIGNVPGGWGEIQRVEALLSNDVSSSKLKPADIKHKVYPHATRKAKLINMGIALLLIVCIKLQKSKPNLNTVKKPLSVMKTLRV